MIISVLAHAFPHGDDNLRSVSTATDRLLNRLDLVETERSETHTTWLGSAGSNALNYSQRLFGGMVVAQAIVAAGRTDPTRTIQSLQQVFLRGGRADSPLNYVVHRLFEGNTYASLRVEVHQEDDIISQAQVGLSSGIDGGPDRFDPTPSTTPFESTVNRDELHKRPGWDDQPVEVRIDPARNDDGKPELDLWIRPLSPLPDDVLMHQAVMGYVSDRAFMGTAWKPHYNDVGLFKGSTLDHTIWFHRPVDFNQWHTFSMTSPAINDGRGLNIGCIYNGAGERVASLAQQGTYRPIGKHADD